MLLSKQIRILVFKIDDEGTFDNIGEVNQFDSLVWPDKFNGYTTFELWAPVNDENAEYLRKGNVLWTGGDNATIIEIVKSSVNDDGSKTFNVKGRTLEMLMTTRIIWGSYNAKSKYASTVMYEIVDQNCVNPNDPKRKIPFLELAEDRQFGGQISFQKTGGEVYDSLTNIASTVDVGFSVLFRPREKKLIFEVIEGVDRTIDQSNVDPVEFSTDLEDILTSSYYTNDEDMKSVALVLGEGEGAERVRQTAGDESSFGFGRRELFVDARDIQSETINNNGETETLTPEEYAQALESRGDEKLIEYRPVESFEAKIRVFGNVQYEFGVDYNKGDKVTVRDKQLNVVVSARITEVEEDFDDEYELILTFGYSYPTIMQKVKRQMV